MQPFDEEIVKSLYDWNPWLEGELPPELLGFPRDYFLEPYLQIPEIKVLEGGRRVGKSTLLYQVIHLLLKQGKPVLYINFEDEVLKKYSLSEIVSAFEGVAPVENLFLDEIQNCREWVEFVRKAYDRKELSQIWISGSNASFLQKEFSTLLTGRNITLAIYPLSFTEYLRFKGEEITPSFSSQKEGLIKKHFQNYLEMGAFPAVTLRSVLQKELLTSYFEDFLYKDIATRYDVDLRKLKELGIYLATNSAKNFSYRKVAQALHIHHQTVAQYCSYFNEIFLFYELYKFDYSLKNQIGSDKKIYIADTGLANAISFRFSEDTGRILENVVFNELKRRKADLYFHKQQYECDFLLKEGFQITHAIQVTKTLLDPDTKKRELRGLTEALLAHKLQEGLILTLNEEGEETAEGLRLHIKPLWKWLLKL